LAASNRAKKASQKWQSPSLLLEALILVELLGVRIAASPIVPRDGQLLSAMKQITNLCFIFLSSSISLTKVGLSLP
jgi:hypothetical protein